jgi:phosphoglycerol transferase MdoB-like AlkP superfamily enzyme
MPHGDTTPDQGSRYFVTAFRLAAGALVGCVALQLFLYVRPGAYGGPFLVEWQRYFWLALYYEMLGVWLLSAPFFVYWLWRYRCPVRTRAAGWLLGAQVAVLTLNLFLSQLDHEVLRFLGIRLGFSFAATYVRPGTVTDSLFYDALREDPGGPFVSLALLIAVPAAYAWWARRQVRRRSGGGGRLWFSAALVLALVPLLAPANGWRMATSQFRLRKVEPIVIALAVDATQGFGDLAEPADFARLAAEYQARWLAESTDKAWRFPDPDRPYLREPTASNPPQEVQWNVILIQLETLRGIDVGHLNPERRPSPTPYLDSLARRGQAAVFTHASSFAQPTINAMFAAHCSITPHSRRYVTAFTQTAFYCLPEALRRRGYRTEMFNAGDTDWDGSTLWLSRWYDSLRRYPDAKERDRPVFRAAARRIRELGASGRPFLASVVSVTNHTPFSTPEPRLDLVENTLPQQRIVNTTRYTDDVVREFIGSLENEPWFARTIVVVYGDHGFNLGEHGGTTGEINLYREGVWVPLLFAGAHPRLPRGMNEVPASLLDIAPTLADLLGIREANSWQGHSLLAAEPERSFHFRLREIVLAEEGALTVVTDPASGALRLYDREGDWRQRRPLTGNVAEAGALVRRASDTARLNDFLLRRNRIWQAREP